MVYIVHSGQAPGTGANISDAQVQSQMTALNDHFSGTGIKFCLATKRGSTAIPLPSGGIQTTPGIIHVNSPTHVNPNFTPASLGNLASVISGQMSPNNYLNIYVVNSINGLNSGILGFAPFANTNIFNGILMRYDAFGDVSNCSGCNLVPANNQGKVLTHEVGHYLSLFHTFEGGCSGVDDGVMNPDGVPVCNVDGDRVCDTPQGNMFYGCPTAITSCANDAIPNRRNFMQYSDDACRDEFSPGQISRMLASLSLFRPTLYSTQNLIYTGVCGYQNLLSAAFTPSSFQPCQNTAVTFVPQLVSHPNTTYSWNFGDGSTSTSTTSVSHTFASAQDSPYTVTLTLTRNGETTHHSIQVYVSACTPVPAASAKWLLSTNNAVDFSSGAPVVLSNAVPSTNTFFLNVTSASNTAGDLLFYTNGVTVWRNNNTVVNSSSGTYVPLKGNIASLDGSLAVPIPGTSNYYIFTKGSVNDGIFQNVDNVLDGFRRTQINVSGNTVSIPAASMNSPITPLSGMTGYLQGNDNAMYGGAAIHAVRKCDGYWIFTTLRKSSTQLDLVVISLTASGLTFVNSASTPVLTPNFNNLETIQVSPDGNKVVYRNNNYTDVVVYDFNKITGVLSNRLTVLPFVTSQIDRTEGISFSPNSKLLYVSVRSGGLYQINLDSPNPALTRKVVSPSVFNRMMRLAPDGKIYFMDDLKADKFSMSVIHFPNMPITSAEPNACGYSPHGPAFGNTVFSASIRTCISNLVTPMGTNSISAFANGCNSYKFFPNIAQTSCFNSFNWNFGDPASGSANVSTQTTPTHVFNNPGTYTVTLRSSTNVLIAQKTVTIVPMPAAVIQGSSDACLTINNRTYNSVNLLDGQTAQWSITGGAGTIVSQNNQSAVEIAWTSLPGTISVTVTNTSGCTSTVSKQITQLCCPCFDDLFYMAWPNEFGSALNFGIWLDNELGCDWYDYPTSSILWNYGDGSPPTTVSSHQFPATGNYTVSATINLDGCMTTISFPVDAGGPGTGPTIPGNPGTPGTGTSRMGDSFRLTPEIGKKPFVSPNPSTGALDLHIPDFRGKVAITVSDMNGRIVFEKTDAAFSAHANLNLGFLQPGVYLLSVRGENLTFARKIIRN